MNWQICMMYSILIVLGTSIAMWLIKTFGPDKIGYTIVTMLAGIGFMRCMQLIGLLAIG